MKRVLSTGPAESRFLTDLERLEIPVFSLKRHRTLLDDIADPDLYDLLTELEDKGWLLRVEQGTYVVVPRAARRTWHEHPFIIAAAMAPDPYYISYWSALSFHNVTAQMPRIVVVVIPVDHRRRRSQVTFQGYHYQFVSRSETTFFGVRSHDMTGLNGAAHVEVMIADPEKAILDSLDDERLAGGIAEIIESLRRGLTNGSLSLPHLVDDALRYPNRAVINRLGYLLSRSGADKDVLDALRGRMRRTGYPPYLSRVAPRIEAHRDPEWNVMVNVSNDSTPHPAEIRPPNREQGMERQDLYTTIRPKEAEWDAALRVLVVDPLCNDNALALVEKGRRPIVSRVTDYTGR